MSAQKFFDNKFNGKDMAMTQQKARRGVDEEQQLGLVDPPLDPVSLKYLSALDQPPKFTRRPERDRDYDDGALSTSRVRNPSLVIAFNGYDVVAFGPIRRLAEGVSRETAEAIVARGGR